MGSRCWPRAPPSVPWPPSGGRTTGPATARPGSLALQLVLPPGWQGPRPRHRGHGSPCRCAWRAAIPRAAMWTFQPAITSNRGPVALRFTAPIPTPSGAAVVKRAFGAMGLLRSAKLHEDLRGELGGPAIESDYRFQAPDAFS